jgi:resuscitation-promoting factor RpfB
MASDSGSIVAQDKAPAGWYQESDGGWRYWDGAAWTGASPAAANTWPAPVNSAEQATRRSSPTVSRGQAALATVCVLLSLALLGGLAQQPKGRTVVVGTTLATEVDVATTVGTSAPATTYTVTAPSTPTPVTTAAAIENTVLAARATPAETTPPSETSTNSSTAVATTLAPTTAAATTVLLATAPTYSQEQIAYFEALAQAATSTTQPEVVTPPSAGCGAGAYTNSNGSCVPRPIAAPTAPAGATARCNDGTYSFSQTRRGTCSSHKGVAEWL